MTSFVLYTDYIDQVELLSMEQRGLLLSAIMCYAAGKELPELDGMVTMAFSFIRKQIDRDNEKYQEKVEKCREAGKLGGRPKKNPEEKPDGLSEKPEKAEKADGFLEKQPKAKKADGFLEKRKNHDTDTISVPDTVPVKTEREACAHARGERFPEFFAGYPKQEGQQMAAQEYISLLTSTQALEEADLIQAAKNYTEACAISGTQPRFIKKASNWLSDGVWMDYLPGKYQKPAVTKAQPNNNRFNAFPQRAYTSADYQSMEQRLLNREKGA